jgi:hypothetical protein
MQTFKQIKPYNLLYGFFICYYMTDTKEINKLDEVSELYTTYLRLMPDLKIDSGDLLNIAGSILLSLDTAKYDNNSKLHRNYLMNKVAFDLLNQARDMAHTKEYDLSQIPQKLTYLAFELAYEYYESKPDRNLIPYLKAVIDYEKYSHDLSQLEWYKDLLRASIREEENYLRTAKAS